MDDLFQTDRIYYILLGVSLLLIPAYFLYAKNLQIYNMTKDLSNLEDLLDYSNIFLSDYFSLTTANLLTNNFLENKYLYNFFRNLIILYPSPEFLFLGFEIDEKKSLINFFEVVKSNSYENFIKTPIKKDVFYKLLYYINKNVFTLDI